MGIKGAEEARSETVRRSLKEWYSSVARTRLQPGGAIVIIQTRWHEDELAGWLLNEHGGEGWHVLSMPAITETDEPFRKAGVALTLSRLFILWTGFLRLDGNLRGQEHICAVHFVVRSRDLVADG